MSDLLLDRLGSIFDIVSGQAPEGTDPYATVDVEEPTQAPTTEPATTEPAPAQPVTGKAKSPFIDTALAQAGDAYVWGAGRNSEADPVAFDCSGLVYWAAKQVGVRVGGTAYDQWRQTEQMTVEEALRTPGALLFNGDGTGTGRDAITHVAISLGDGRTIEARGRRFGVVVVDAATNARRFRFAGRIAQLTSTAGAGPTSLVASQRPPAEDLMGRLSAIGGILSGGPR